MQLAAEKRWPEKAPVTSTQKQSNLREKSPERRLTVTGSGRGALIDVVFAVVTA